MTRVLLNKQQVQQGENLQFEIVDYSEKAIAIVKREALERIVILNK
jgi:hypothetical protein